jgi:hypothetical protein
MKKWLGRLLVNKLPLTMLKQHCSLDMNIERKFESEKYKRLVTDCNDIDEIKRVTLQLIDSYYSNAQFIQELLFKQL